MTQDFRETKIKTLSEEHSRAFQEAVIAAGGTWHSGGGAVKYLSAKFLFVDADLNLSYEVSDRDYFDSHEYKEIQFSLPTQKATFDEDEALSLAERTFSTEIDEQLASDIIQYASRLHSRYMQQSAPDVVTQILSLISDECRYWHGRDEARRGGYAILHAKAKELISKQQPI